MRLRISLALCLVCAAAMSAAQRLDVSVRGEAQAAQTGELVLQGGLQGDVQGTIRATLRVDGPSQVTGDWTLRRVAEHADGTTSEAGVLMGRIEAGTALADGTGVVALRDVKLVITGGLGEYAGLSAGEGTFDVHLGPAGGPFQASLSLTF